MNEELIRQMMRLDGKCDEEIEATLSALADQHIDQRRDDFMAEELAWGARWTKQPTEAGFYYWQNAELRAISENAVRVVQLRKYANREGFACESLTSDRHPPVFNCDLGQEPPGWWCGPLPQPQ